MNENRKFDIRQIGWEELWGRRNRKWAVAVSRVDKRLPVGWVSLAGRREVGAPDEASTGADDEASTHAPDEASTDEADAPDEAVCAGIQVSG